MEAPPETPKAGGEPDGGDETMATEGEEIKEGDDPNAGEGDMTVGYGTAHDNTGKSSAKRYRRICMIILISICGLNFLIAIMVASTTSGLLGCQGSLHGHSICAMSGWGHPFSYVIFCIVQELIGLLKLLPTAPLGVVFGNRKFIALGEVVGGYLILMQLVYGISVMEFDCVESDLVKSGASMGQCKTLKFFILISMFMSYIRCQIGVITFYRHAMLLDPRYDLEVDCVEDAISKNIMEEETEIVEMKNATYFESEIEAEEGGEATGAEDGIELKEM